MPAPIIATDEKFLRQTLGLARRGVIGSFLDARMADKVYAFMAPIVVGGASAVSAVGERGVDKIAKALHLNKLTLRRFGDTMLISGSVS